MLPSGGGIRVLRQFSNGLAQNFNVRLHYPEGGSSQEKGEILPETVYPYPLWKKPSGALRPAAPLFLIARLLSFKHVCRRIAADINSTADTALIHNSMPVAAPPILDYLNIPSLYFCFEHPRHIYEHDIIKRTQSPLAELALKPLCSVEKRMDKKSAQNASRIVTFSEYMKQNIKRYYRRESSIVRPGIDTNFFHPAQTGNSRDNFVMSVGALWPFKGHETAVRILGLIPSAERPSLRIVADREYPGYSQKLITLARELSVKISIDKLITDIHLRALYQRARAVLCCQRREPYGLVPLEAMACGTPVIAIQEGGFVDNIIHGKNGFLFSGSPQIGSELLLEIFSNSALTTKMRLAGIDFTRKERTITQGINELGEILENL